MRHGSHYRPLSIETQATRSLNSRFIIIISFHETSSLQEHIISLNSAFSFKGIIFPLPVETSGGGGKEESMNN